MTRAELQELHYITPIANLPSILQVGLLSHKQATQVRHQSVAMEEVQTRRSNVILPTRRPLHEYANVYIYARNTMMYVLRAKHADLCVLRIIPEVLDLPGTIIADHNAASGWARFRPAAPGLEAIDRDRVFSEWWTHDDQMETMRHRAAMCAEVLVPGSVPPQYISGAYVSCQQSQQALRQMATDLEVMVNAYLFFR